VVFLGKSSYENWGDILKGLHGVPAYFFKIFDPKISAPLFFLGPRDNIFALFQEFVRIKIPRIFVHHYFIIIILLF